MLDIHETWTADDLPTLDDSEVSVLSHAQARMLEDVDPEESGLRWLLERPEALLDVQRFGDSLERRGRRPSRTPTTHVR